MKVSDAKAIARAWVKERVAEVPRCWGVIFGGSINWLPEDAELGSHSDVDLWYYVSGELDPGLGQRKILHEGLILEESYFSLEPYRDEEAILGDWAVGHHFTAPNVIHDPSGVLTRLRPRVAQRFAEPFWIRRRCENVATGVRGDLLPVLRGEADNPFPEVIFGFTVANITALPTIALVRPPTVRNGGVRFAEAMRALHREDLVERRLELLGSLRLGRDEVEELLRAYTRMYDRAATVVRTHFWGEFDLMPAARPCMIGGARDLIDRGYHREAVFWMYVGSVFSSIALRNDAADEWATTHRAPYESLLSTLGIGDAAGYRAKAVIAEGLLTELMVLAADIIEGKHGQ
jgi:hypothetical protein